jgi:hypothetical protein
MCPGNIVPFYPGHYFYITLSCSKQNKNIFKKIPTSQFKKKGDVGSELTYFSLLETISPS